MIKKTVTIQDLKNGSEPFFNKYNSYIFKTELIKEIANNCLYIEDGITKIDYCQLDFMLEIAMIENYTSVKLFNDETDSEENSIISDYDFLKENGLIGEIIEYAIEDYNYLKTKILDTINQEIKLKNSLENVVRQGLEKLISKIPDEKGMAKMIKNLPNMVNKIDTDKMELLKDVVGFNKGVKK